MGQDRRAQRPRRGIPHRPRHRQGLRPSRKTRSGSSTRRTRRVFRASFRAQFISGIIQPTMNFISNLNYVAIGVIGGVQVASGTMSLGDVQAFIQYSRSFTHADHADREHRQPAPVDHGLAPSGSSNFSTSPRKCPTRPSPAVLGTPTGHVTLEGRLVPIRARQAAHRRPQRRRPPGRSPGHRRTDRRRQDDGRQPADALLRDRRRRDLASTASTSAS